jgi:RNA polymerase sigma-70 factor (ECF subfamily)
MSVPIEQLGERMIDLLPRLRRLAQAILETAPAEDPAWQCADDVVQDCIERALRSQVSWQDQRAFENGMFGMLTRACAAADPHAVQHSARSAQHVDRPSTATLRQTYAALPLQQRAAIALVVLEQRSYRDAAAMLEMPLPTLTQQLWQGREKLQAQLQA